MVEFNAKQIEDFVHEHLQQKIDANEVPLMGLDMTNAENFEREWDIYSTALFEGICNGILMAGGIITEIQNNE